MQRTAKIYGYLNYKEDFITYRIYIKITFKKNITTCYIFVILKITVDKMIYTVGINKTKDFLTIFGCGKVVKNEYSHKNKNNLVFIKCF